MADRRTRTDRSKEVSGGRTGSPAALALLLALAVAWMGCGGSSATSEAQTDTDPLAGYPKGPTRQFIDPGGDNAVQEYGREATPGERERVSAMVKGWLRAEASGNWGRVCRYLDELNIREAIHFASYTSQNRIHSCGKAVAVLASEHDPIRDNIKGGVASLRIGQGHGYAQYHGREGRDWVMPVRREDGRWKLSSLYPLERFK
jgi:hypothetical protein